jgi:hypothetical protein
MFLIFIDFRIFLVIIVGHFNGEGALHESFILGGDFSGGSSINHISVIAAANQERAEGNSKIKTVTSLPVEHIRRGWDDFWKLVCVLKLFIFKEISDELRALVPIIELCVRKLSWSKSCAYELANAALVLRSEKKLAVRVIYHLELTLVLQHVLKNELFFRSVLKIRSRRTHVLKDLIYERDLTLKPAQRIVLAEMPNSRASGGSIPLS